MAEDPRPRLVGINHVALEVGDIDAALEFYGRWFRFTLRSRSDSAAFIDLADQFLALTKVDEPHRDAQRHFGLVVDDREGLRARMETAGVTFVSQKRFDFLDPWGNRVEIVPYPDIRFQKTPDALAALGTSPAKTDAAREEITKAGLTPPDP
jgi:catechol 2,3-dioxygenase-like lactoylglutathione lyase family enzyme